MMTQKSVTGSENRLQLRGVGREARVGEIAVNYEEMAKPHGIAKSIIPTYNHDRLFFTPAFFLPTDQKYYAQNSTFQRFQFKEKIERNLEFINLRTPHKLADCLKPPAPNSDYCQICHQKYENYFVHTSEEGHLQTAKKNTINQAILDLCHSFSKTREKEVVTIKTKGIKKALRSQRQESIRVNPISKEDTINDGSECFPKSLNQSTTVRGKDDLSGVN